MKCKSCNLQNIIDNEGTYSYKLVLNGKKPIEKLFLSRINEIMSTRNMTVKDAILDIFASQCVCLENSVSDGSVIKKEKMVDNKNVDNFGEKNIAETKIEPSSDSISHNNIDNKDISKNSSGIADVDPDVTQEMKSVFASMFGN